MYTITAIVTENSTVTAIGTETLHSNSKSDGKLSQKEQ